MFYRFNIVSYLSPIYMKLSLSSELSTSSTRLDRWSAGLQKFLDADNPLFGYGPGYFSSADELSTLSWYLMVLVESGLISFLLIIIFFGLVFSRIVCMRHQARPAFLIGFVAGCGHLLVISTFYHPFIWLLMAILYVQLAHIRNDIRKTVVP
jgi:O-antigen ligase